MKDTQQAGSDLDALVAEKVMGWKVVRVPEPRDENDDRPAITVEPTEPFDLWSRAYGWSGLPQFSTRIADAWMVVERLAALGHYTEINDQRHGFYRWNRNGPPWKGFHVTTFHPIQDENPDFDGAPAEGASAFADTAPLAICIVGLKVVG